MKKILLCLTIAACFIACKKKTDEVPLEQYSLTGFLKKTGFNQKVVTENNPSNMSFEIGILFKPLKEGSLTAFKIRLPSVNNNYKILLWDVATQQPILSQVCNYTSLNSEAIFTLPTPTTLVKNKTYCISYLLSPNSTIFRNERNDRSDANFPVIFNDIKILALSEAPPSTPNLRTFPSIPITDSYYGDVSFNFQ